MRGKPSRKCFLINQMIWPQRLATDKLYFLYHTRFDNSVYFKASKEIKNDWTFLIVAQLLTGS